MMCGDGQCLVIELRCDSQYDCLDGTDEDNCGECQCQEPTGSSKQLIGARYLGHVTGYEPIRDQYLLIRSDPEYM